nr:uncharacterized protein LOC109172327 [Ipomoea batatas]
MLRAEARALLVEGAQADVEANSPSATPSVDLSCMRGVRGPTSTLSNSPFCRAHVEGLAFSRVYMPMISELTPESSSFSHPPISQAHIEEPSSPYEVEIHFAPRIQAHGMSSSPRETQISSNLATKSTKSLSSAAMSTKSQSSVDKSTRSQRSTTVSTENPSSASMSIKSSSSTPKSQSSLTYLDRFEFKGRKIERTAPAITTWTEEAVKKRIKSEILSGQFGRGKVIPQFQMEEKQVPEQIAEKEWKVTSVLRKMADTEFEFAEVMAEIGNTRTGGGIIKKTFENIAGMINVMSCSQPPPQEGLLDDDDIFNQQSFLDAVSALEQAFMQTTKNYPAQPTQPTTL